MLHGSVNAAFICADFISLYVAIEVISIATFLLIAYSRSDRAIWVGLRYLFVSNVAMLFYLIGAVLVYKSSQILRLYRIRSSPTRSSRLDFPGSFGQGRDFRIRFVVTFNSLRSRDSSIGYALRGRDQSRRIAPSAMCADVRND